MKFTTTNCVKLAAILAVALAAVMFPQHFSGHEGAAVAVVGIGIVDVFSDDAFGVVTMSELVSKRPYVPGQAGSAVPWAEQGYATTSLAIEQLQEDIGLVPPTPRGGPGTTFDKEKRSLLQLKMPHFQIDDAIYADEVQGVRAAGGDNLEDLQAYMARRIGNHFTLRIDPTLELAKLGALKGIITYADATTLNLFTLFGVTQPTEVNFDLDTDADGKIRKKCAGVVRTISTALRGLPYAGVKALCSPEYFDALIMNAEVRATYLNQQQAAELRGGYAFNQLDFGGIIFQEYRGSGSSLTIEANKANFFPMGVPGMFKVAYAPADYNETVNTIGLPRYSKLVPMKNDKGYEIECQTNPLVYCIRPEALVQGRLT